MLKRSTVPGAVALALGLAACGSSASTTASVSARPTKLYTVYMTGAAEGHRGALHAHGYAIVAFHGAREVCFRFAHLHGFIDATAAHIHVGATGRSGPIVEYLSPGPALHHQGCRTIRPALSRRIWSRPSDYYVNVQSRRYPLGAVRAQL